MLNNLIYIILFTFFRLCARCKNIISVENKNSDFIIQDTTNTRSTIKLNETDTESRIKKISENEICINSQIWCVDCNENVVVLGCADGSLQFWDLYKGILRV